MDKKLEIKQSIQINAPVEKVWEVLTSSEYIKQYMYGCDAITNWKVGSPLLWKGAADGKVYVKGEIVTFEQNKLLGYTTFDPNNPEYKDEPTNYILATWELSIGDGMTTLTATQSGFEHVQNGEERYKHSSVGGNEILVKIKELAEK